MPVSYTHLDVYKRQLWVCSVAALINRADIGSNLVLILDETGGANYTVGIAQHNSNGIKLPATLVLIFPLYFITVLWAKNSLYFK